MWGLGVLGFRELMTFQDLGTNVLSRKSHKGLGTPLQPLHTTKHNNMSNILNSFMGGYIGDYIGDYYRAY